MKFGALLFAMLFVTAACGSGSTSTGKDAAGGNGGTGGANLDGSAGSGGTAGPEAGRVADTNSPKLNTGDPCTSDDQCPSITTGRGLCMTDWPGGGYCASLACVTPIMCMDNSTCADYQGTMRCLVACFQPSDCRSGYTCATNGACVPTN